MALKKSTKRLLTILFVFVLPFVAVYWFFFRTLTDKFGNKWKLDRAGGLDPDQKGYLVLKNGTGASGYLKSISIGSDGMLHGVQTDGTRYFWNNYWQKES